MQVKDQVFCATDPTICCTFDCKVGDSLMFQLNNLKIAKFLQVGIKKTGNLIATSIDCVQLLDIVLDQQTIVLLLLVIYLGVYIKLFDLAELR